MTTLALARRRWIWCEHQYGMECCNATLDVALKINSVALRSFIRASRDGTTIGRHFVHNCWCKRMHLHCAVVLGVVCIITQAIPYSIPLYYLESWDDLDVIVLILSITPPWPLHVSLPPSTPSIHPPSHPTYIIPKDLFELNRYFNPHQHHRRNVWSLNRIWLSSTPPISGNDRSTSGNDRTLERIQYTRPLHSRRSIHPPCTVPSMHQPPSSGNLMLSRRHGCKISVFFQNAADTLFFVAHYRSTERTFDSWSRARLGQELVAGPAFERAAQIDEEQSRLACEISRVGDELWATPLA